MMESLCEGLNDLVVVCSHNILNKCFNVDKIQEINVAMLNNMKPSIENLKVNNNFYLTFYWLLNYLRTYLVNSSVYFFLFQLQGNTGYGASFCPIFETSELYHQASNSLLIGDQIEELKKLTEDKEQISFHLSPSSASSSTPDLKESSNILIIFVIFVFHTCQYFK